MVDRNVKEAETVDWILYESTGREPGNEMGMLQMSIEKSVVRL
jgi:hypothetical protein